MPSTVPTTEHTELAERAATHTLGVLSQASGMDPTVPTPCPGWDLQRLLLHVADASDLLAGLVTTGERHVPHRRPSEAADPAGLAGTRVRHLLQTLTAAASADRVSDDRRAAWAREAACGAAIELTAHAWDIAVVSSPGAQVPDVLAADVLDLARTLVSEDQRRGFFGPRVDVRPTAAASERLLGFLGRDPGWHAGRSAPVCPTAPG